MSGRDEEHLVGYGLGVDLGTTYTAAAVRRDGRVEIVRLGSRRAEMPSVVFVPEQGPVLVGEPAERRGAAEPARLAREFKRRVGDPVAMLVGGAPYSAHALMARLLEHVLRTVTAQQGEPPEAVTVTHPANWGPYKRELFGQAVRLADVENVRLRTEPEAAAVQHTTGGRIAEGAIIAVYDLGGGTFDAAVLRRTGTGFELLGEPEGIEQLGGIDFDEAVFGHVLSAIGDDVVLDGDEAVAALTRLRRDCVEAKESLSDDTEVTIPVALPGLHTRVRLNRTEFEDMINPALADTVAAMRRAMRSAGVQPAEVQSILLAGGSSRIPLVSQLLGTEFDRPTVLDPHPEHGIALGAARLTIPLAAAPPTPVLPTPVPPTPTAPAPDPSRALDLTSPTVVAPRGVAAVSRPVPVPSPPSPQPPEPAAQPPATVQPPRAFATGKASIPGSGAAGTDGAGTARDTTRTDGVRPLGTLPPPPVVPRPAGDEPTQALTEPLTGADSGNRRGRWPLVAVPLLVVGLIGAVVAAVQWWPTDPGQNDVAGPAASSSVTAPVCGWTDGFSGGEIDPKWEHVRPEARSILAGGRLELDAPDGSDIYESELRAPMLLRPVAGNIGGEVVLETDVIADPRQYYQGAGLVLWNGSRNYVRLERGFGDVGAIAFEYKSNGGKHTKVRAPDTRDPNVVRTEATQVVLQLTWSKDAVSARWKPYGQEDWEQLGTIDIKLPVSTKVGIAVLNRAQSGATPTDFIAGFDYVKASC